MFGTATTTGTLRIAAASSFSTSKTVTLSAGGGRIQVDNAGAAATFSGAIGSSGRLTKLGAGKLTLSSADNDYSGGTTIDAGTVEVSSDGNLGTGALTFDGGTLRITADTTFSTSKMLTLDSGGGTINVVDSAAIATLSGQISGDGSLTKEGDGYLTLGYDNSAVQTGDTIVNHGILRIGVDNALGSASDLVVNSGGHVSLFAHNVTVASLSGSGLVNDGTVGGTTKTLTVSGAADSTFTGTIADGTVNHVALTKGGAGTLTLTGTSTYTGGTTINAGRLRLGDGTTTGSIVGNVSNDGSLEFACGPGGSSYSGVISGDGDVTYALNAGGWLWRGGPSTYTGGTTITSGAVYLADGAALGDAGGSLSVNADAWLSLYLCPITVGSLEGSGNIVANRGAAGATTLTVSGGGTFSGVLGDGSTEGSLALMKSGSETLTLDGNSIHTGATTVAEGILDISGSLMSDLSIIDGQVTGPGARAGGRSHSTAATRVKRHGPPTPT